jgi:zinc protease
MACSTSDDKFKTEREVVKEERGCYENQPFGRLPEIIFDKVLDAPVQAPDDREHAGSRRRRFATCEFHDTYYVPNSDARRRFHDEGRAAYVEHVGKVPRKPVPRDIPQEPPHKAEEKYTVTESWPLPAVVVSYHITYDGHPDAYPLHVLAKILSDGDSSRIYRSLVYQKQLALAAFGEAKLIENPNLFYAVAIVQPGHTPDEVIKALQGEIDRIKTEGVTEEESHAPSGMDARLHPQRDTIQQKALHLAHAIVIHNDVKTADGEHDLFQNVTLADIQRVARIYFTPESRMPSPCCPEAGPAGRVGRMMRTSLERSLSRPRRSSPRSSRRGQPSRRLAPFECAAAAASGAARSFPPYQLKTLANGLQVLVAAPRAAVGELPADSARGRDAGGHRQTRRGELRRVFIESRHGDEIG